MAEEIEALRCDRRLSTIVFFLDETFEAGAHTRPLLSST
jgi:hypothetical protein